MFPAIVKSDILDRTDRFNIVDGNYAFRPGEQFDSYEQLVERLYLHSEESFVYYWHRDSRTVTNASKRTSRPISAQLKYYSLRLVCVYGGPRKQTAPSKQRAVKENERRTTNCPGFILLHASKCGQKLEVVSVCNTHNHDISKETTENLPQKRKLNDLTKEEVIEMLKLNVDRKQIIDYVQMRDNKTITRKCLFNLVARLRTPDLPLLNPKFRAQILQRILQFSQEKAIHAVVTRELTQYYPDIIKKDHQIEKTDFIEYSSPEQNDFSVNERTIGSIVNTEEDFYNRTATTNEYNSPLILYENSLSPREDKNDIFIGKHELLDTATMHFQNAVRNDCEAFENQQSTVDSLMDDQLESSNILYENKVNETHSVQYSDSVFRNNGSVVLYETTTDMTSMALNQDSVQSASQQDDSNCRTRMQKKWTNDQTNANRLINKLAKRISRCSKCRTDSRLVRAQLEYLKAKRRKLLIKTKLLWLKKKKLLREIKLLE